MALIAQTKAMINAMNQVMAVYLAKMRAVIEEAASMALEVVPIINLLRNLV